MTKILVLGQTPPPFGGQALMIQRLLEGNYENAALFHVRMGFARDTEDMGEVRLGKLCHLFRVIAKTLWIRIRHGADVLYYPLSGPDHLPLFRDIALLLAVRWAFRRTVFHFHAAGGTALYPTLGPPLRVLYRLALIAPDLAIELSAHNPRDGLALKAGRVRVVPNGIEDEAGAFIRAAAPNGPLRVLFVGLIAESKGILVLLDALRMARQDGADMYLNAVGGFSSAAFRQRVLETVREQGLADCVAFPGVLSGSPKHMAFREADVFCFPSYFASESFGLVVLEAMQFGLPVVATRWRGLQDLVEDGVTGFLVPLRDSAAVSARLLELARSPSERLEMGRRGRERFLKHYTVQAFWSRMDDCFQEI